jgi:hypothetical protein
LAPRRDGLVSERSHAPAEGGCASLRCEGCSDTSGGCQTGSFTRASSIPSPPGAAKRLERHELECTSNNSRKIGVFDGFSENCFELGTAAPFDEAFDAILDTDRASEFVELLP